MILGLNIQASTDSTNLNKKTKEQIEKIMSELDIKILHGNEAKPFLNDIAQMRIEMFREFPYLYDGSIEYERNYLEGYFSSPSSTIILGFSGKRLIAFSSSIALNDEMDEIKQPFIDQKLPLKDYFYIGEMMIQPEFRGKGLLRQFFDTQENYAKQNGYKHSVFMTVRRSDEHIERPEDYKDIAPIWRHFEYEILPNMQIDMPWQRVDTGKEEMNVLDVWYKKIN